MNHHADTTFVPAGHAYVDFVDTIVTALQTSCDRDEIVHVNLGWLPEASAVVTIAKVNKFQVEGYVETNEFIELWGVNQDGETFRIQIDAPEEDVPYEY